MDGMAYPTRKAMRLKEYDYTETGYYFVTICTKTRNQAVLCTVGDAALGVPPTICLTPAGELVQQLILNIGQTYATITVDSFVIMPDHVHLILDIQNQLDGSPRAATPTAGVPQVVNALKGLSTKRFGAPLWQRGYHDHIIRTDADLAETRLYIQNNPLNWAEED